MQKDDAAFRKRTQIQKTNRTMFIWVAAMSAFIGISLVLIVFLVQVLLYNERVLIAKNETVANLEYNNNNIEELKSQIRILDTNQALANLKAGEGDQTIQVILDALPSDANSLALGSSIKERLLAPVMSLTLNSMSVDPVAGIEYFEDNVGVVGNPNVNPDSNEIAFYFSVTGSDTSLKNVLENLEKSIRTMKVVSLKIESQGADRVMAIEGRAYYEPEKVIELVDKVVK